jgi:hypothetical protein
VSTFLDHVFLLGFGHGNKFRRFSPIRTRRKYYDYLPQGFVTIDKLLVLACPCDFLVFNEILRCPRIRHSRARVSSVTILPSVLDFPTYLLRLPHWERYLLEHVSSDLAFGDIVAFLSEYGGVGVSEGSSARHLGSFRWALATPEGQRLAKCSGLVYGTIQAPSGPKRPTYSRYFCSCCISESSLTSQLIVQSPSTSITRVWW